MCVDTLSKIIDELDACSVVKEIPISECAISSVIDIQQCLQAISINTKEEPISLVDSLQKIRSSLSCLKIIAYNEQKFIQLENDCCYLLDKMKQVGKRVECPIYKEVIYNGQECVPYNL